MTDVPARGESPAPADEVSLRDLYLVLRRRIGWIVAAALIAAAGAFLFLSLRPAVYLAEATTVVARAPIEVGIGTGLRLKPEVDLTFDTYWTLAFSRGVLESVLPLHEAAELARLRDRLSIERVAGSATQPSALLAVVHRVRSSDPQRAAATASAWAEATIVTARRLLLENLDAVESITGEDLEAARSRLEEAETELEQFRAASGIDSLRTRATALDLAIGTVEAAMRANRVAASQRAAELASLRARAEAGQGGLEVVLAGAPEVVLTVEAAVASVEAQATALAAEREALAEELASLRSERQATAVALAEAGVALARLERAAAGPRELVASLSAIEPTVAYVAQVVPAGARVLSEAPVPSAPEPTRRALTALLTAVVVGFAGVVTALLAEAVRDPRAPRR